MASDSEQLPPEYVHYYEDLIANMIPTITPINRDEEIHEADVINELFPYEMDDVENMNTQNTNANTPNATEIEFPETYQSTYVDNNGTTRSILTTVTMTGNLDNFNMDIPNLGMEPETRTAMLNAMLRIMNSIPDQLMNNNIFGSLQDVRTPLTQSAIRNLIEKKFSEITDSNRTEECAICQDKFNNDSVINILPCHHYFHKDCIQTWLNQYHHICPVCRADCGEHQAQM